MKNTNPTQSNSCPDNLPKVIINALDDIIYVSDIETYDLLFLNEYGKKQFGLEDVTGHKCYKVLQGHDRPCPYCTNDKLTRDSFHVWEWTSPVTHRHYILKDKLIEWDNRLVRLEVAVDITEKENVSYETQHKLEIERTLLECVRILGQEESFSKGVDMVLANLGTFHKADRAYVFEEAILKDGRKCFNNTHEWCAPGVTAQKENLQNVPVEAVSVWLKHFARNQNIAIKDIECIREERPLEYSILKPQGIHSLICVPIRFEGGMGFIGLDNPARNQDDFSLLESLVFFVSNERNKRNVANRLWEMSFSDSLTGLNNRNSYMQKLKEITASPPQALGIVFADLNGLKRVNDEKGHAAGDEYLKGISTMFRLHFRKDDIFRIGGDEFVALCRNIPEELFHAKIMHFQKDVNLAYPGSLAIGTVWNSGNINIMEMVKKADTLMYEDKKQCASRRVRDS